MTISIIVPNMNGIKILKECLLSLQHQERIPEEIIVVDNGSTDGSQDIIRKEFPDVKLISLPDNTGFTGANNTGIKAATGEMIVLLNNDCIVEPGWLNNLSKRMNDPEVAAVTSSMRNIKDISIMDSAGGKIDWMGFSRDIGKGEPSSSYDKSIEIPFPCGGAVMIRRSALPDPDKLFWSKLFIYQEDLDLGFELLRTGWKIVYEPTAIVRHVHSATMGSGNFFKESLCIRNRLLVLRKHFDESLFSELKPIIKKWQFLWMVVSLLKGRFTLAKAIYYGTRDGLKIPVEKFSASIPVSQVFIRYAYLKTNQGYLKNKMYQQVKKIINPHNNNAEK